MGRSQGPLSHRPPAEAEPVSSPDAEAARPDEQIPLEIAPGSVVVGHDGSANSKKAIEVGFDFALALGLPLAIIRTWSIDHLPRGKSSAGVLWPRFNTRGRVFWRDMHAVTGFWGAALLQEMHLSAHCQGRWGLDVSRATRQFSQTDSVKVPISYVAIWALFRNIQYAHMAQEMHC